MRIKWLGQHMWLLIAGFLLSLASCNVFNPSGEGDSGSGGTEGLILEGEAAMRTQDYDKAYELFSQALKQDSSLSLAWHGLAKASIARDSLPVTEFLKYVKLMSEAPDSTKLRTITGMSDSTKNRFYKPLYRLMVLYKEFYRRDSLGLTDQQFKASNVSLDLQASTLLAGVMFRTLDLRFDTMFTADDRPLQGLFDNLQNGLKPENLDPNKFLQSVDSTFGLNDTTGVIDSNKVADLNNVLVSAKENLSTLTSLVSQQISNADTSNSVDIADVQDMVSKAGDAITFYKFNDKEDNDGDGCIDEEVPDGTDNDGDGLIDEDGRLGYRPPLAQKQPGVAALVSPEDGVLQDRVNATTGAAVLGADDVSSKVLIYADTTGRLTPFTTLVWVDLRNDSLYPSVYANFKAKAEKNKTVLEDKAVLNEVNVEARLAILAITDPVARIKAGKARIGGCWNNVK